MSTENRPDKGDTYVFVNNTLNANKKIKYANKSHIPHIQCIHERYN